MYRLCNNLCALYCCHHCRYIQLNIQFSAAYRKYNEELPAFLHNRPRDFVQHVCQRWLAAHDFTADHVAAAGSRHFSVRSPDSGNIYSVDFGQNDHMPSCGCEDWHRYHWPCKHFCAIFQVTSYTWEDLSACYRDSPYFTIDDDVLKVLPVSQVHVTSSDTDDALATAVSQTTATTEYAVDDAQAAERCAASCRETLRQLQDATYLCTSLQPLQEMQRHLTDMLANIRQQLPAEAGLALNVWQQTVRRVTKRRTTATQHLQSIPVVKRRRPVTRSQKQPAAETATDTQYLPTADDNTPEQRQQQQHLAEKQAETR